MVYAGTRENLSKLISKIEIKADKVTFSEKDKIGEGAFGRVYRGTYPRSVTSFMPSELMAGI